MTSIITKYADPNKRLGEKRQRAISAIDEISSLQLTWTPSGLWLKKWVLEELTRSRDNVKNSYQISSLSTYLSALSACADFLSSTNPFEWDGDDWDEYLNALMKKGNLHFDRTNTQLEDRHKHPLAAIARSLARRHLPVPKHIWARIKEPSEDSQPCDSASSVLITSKDFASAGHLLDDWLSDSPSTRLRAGIRLHLGNHVPMRASEAGNLKRDCFTPSGVLVIERAGFNNIKNLQSIRIWPLSNAAYATAFDLSNELFNYAPSGDLLLRGNGSDTEVIDDLRAADCLSSALKEATMDSRARLHSLRASTLENLAWPDWQANSTRFIKGELTPDAALEWSRTCESNWTLVAQACAAAGHIGIDSALQNYLAGWPCVHALQAYALLCALDTSPAYTRQLGLNDAAWRKAHSRANQCSSDKLQSRWQWFERQLFSPMLKGIWNFGSNIDRAASPPVVDDQLDLTMRETSPDSISNKTQLIYISLRSLGMSAPQSLEVTRIPYTKSLELEQLLPSPDLIASSIRRSRNAPRKRGIKANLDLLQDTLGNALITWFISLPEASRDGAYPLFVRHDVHRSNPDYLEVCKFISHSLPQDLELIVQKGTDHISLEESVSASQIPRFRLIPSRDLGSKPNALIVPVEDKNQVLKSRINSVVRVLFLSASQLKRSSHHE